MQLLGNADFANRASGQRLNCDVHLHVLLTTSVQVSPPSSHSSVASSAGSQRYSKPGDVVSSVVLALRSKFWTNSNFASLGEAIHALDDLAVDVAMIVSKAVEVVLLPEFRWDGFRHESDIFGIREVIVQIKILDVHA